MANKIVLFDKGAATGSEFPLDAATGTNARSIAHMGDDAFLVSIDGARKVVDRYVIDKASNNAKFSGRIVDAAGHVIYGVAFDEDEKNIYAAINYARAGTFTKTITIFDIAGTELDRIVLATSVGFDTLTTVLDLTFDKERLFYQFVTGAIGANHRFRDQIPNAPAGSFCYNTNSGTPDARGLACSKGGTGFWWSHNDGGKTLQLIEPGFQIRDQFAITHAGTMRGMCDTGPLLAMLFN